MTKDKLNYEEIVEDLAIYLHDKDNTWLWEEYFTPERMQHYAVIQEQERAFNEARVIVDYFIDRGYIS